MTQSSVIVFQIDINGIAVDPAECNAPVSVGVDRETAFIAANERMEAEPGQIHIFRPRSVVERPQNIGNPFRVLHAEPAPVTGRKKPFEGFVLERADHIRLVRQRLTIVKQCLTVANRIRPDTLCRRARLPRP